MMAPCGSASSGYTDKSMSSSWWLRLQWINTVHLLIGKLGLLVRKVIGGHDMYMWAFLTNRELICCQLQLLPSSSPASILFLPFLSICLVASIYFDLKKRKREKCMCQGHPNCLSQVDFSWLCKLRSVELLHCPRSFCGVTIHWMHPFKHNICTDIPRSCFLKWM